MSDHPYRESYEEGYYDGKDEAKERIEELEAINAELEKVSSYSLLRQNDRLKAEVAALREENEELRERLRAIAESIVDKMALLQEKGE